jgi:diacylglycerol kinase (ATP)
MKTRVILNPKAGSGRALGVLAEAEAALAAHGIDYRVEPTSGPRDATRLSTIARRDGVDAILAIGGDGTISEVVQGYVEDGRVAEGPKLAVLSAGTGGDFVRTLGGAPSTRERVAGLLTGAERRLDVGLVELEESGGSSQVRAFINILSFGLSGRTDELVNNGPKWLGGRAAFFLGAAAAMATYRNLPVRLRVDEKVVFEGPILTVAIANGRFFGGGMHIAPHADPFDGALEVVVLGNLSFTESLGLSPKIYQGTHTAHEKVSTFRGQKVQAEAIRTGDRLLVDLDGETPGTLPLSAWVSPGAIGLLG